MGALCEDFFVLGFGVPTLSAALGMICINVGMKVRKGG